MGWELQRYQSYTQAQMEATETVQIKLPASDLQPLTVSSQLEGIPRTSLMASVLHQYATSQLGQGLG